MKSEQAIIQFSNVSKSYGETLVLDDVSVSIEEGEFLMLIGRSGCGKTTFLKLINGLLEPDAGTVSVFGEDISSVDKISLRRSIGYVIQSVGLFPHMTVRKNIEYVPGLFRQYPEGIWLLEKIMKLVSLDPDLKNRYPAELSGGQRQRVGIARALAARPKLLLMDEPFGAVDEITRKQLQGSIKDIKDELGLTIIFVTHSVEEAFRLGDRIAIFEDHRIIQIDKPENILKNPADAFVKALIETTDTDGKNNNKL